MKKERKRNLSWIVRMRLKESGNERLKSINDDPRRILIRNGERKWNTKGEREREKKRKEKEGNKERERTKEERVSD